MLTALQAKAARALLGWSQPELAAAAGVSLSTVLDLEKERRALSSDILTRLRAALEKAGVEIIDANGGGPGARLKRRRK